MGYLGYTTVGDLQREVDSYEEVVEFFLPSAGERLLRLRRERLVVGHVLRANRRGQRARPRIYRWLASGRQRRLWFWAVGLQRNLQLDGAASHRFDVSAQSVGPCVDSLQSRWTGAYGNGWRHRYCHRRTPNPWQLAAGSNDISPRR